MTFGIFNPYEAKPVGTNKPDFPSTPQEYHDSETGLGATGESITLDGDSYSLTFYNTTLEDMPIRLEKLMLEVHKLHSKKLATKGINLVALNTEARKGTCNINTPGLSLNIYVGTQDTTDTATLMYRRLAHALYALNIPGLLAEHNVKIITSGF